MTSEAPPPSHHQALEQLLEMLQLRTAANRHAMKKRQQATAKGTRGTLKRP